MAYRTYDKQTQNHKVIRIIIVVYFSQIKSPIYLMMTDVAYIIGVDSS